MGEREGERGKMGQKGSGSIKSKGTSEWCRRMAVERE